MRKRSGHSDDDADFDSNNVNGAGVDDHSDNGENTQQRNVQAVPAKSWRKAVAWLQPVRQKGGNTRRQQAALSSSQAAECAVGLVEGISDTFDREQ